MKFVQTLVAAIAVITVCNNTAYASMGCMELKTMTSNQHNILQKSYSIGKEYDLGETLAAISWVESTAGKNLEGHGSYGGGSYGAFMLLLGNVLKREGGKKFRNTPSSAVLKITPSRTKRAFIQKLKNDFEFSARHAIAELRYWKERVPNSNKHLWAAYNGGYNALTKPGAVRYSEKIKRSISMFHRCNYKFN